jgi:glycosyltransferase involved in cell wall biosynthesis
MRDSDDKPMKITFLLPLAGTNPIGGFKVTYEYANFLAARGHEVSVVHPAVFRMDKPLGKIGLKAAVKTVLGYLKLKRTGGYLPTAWFKMRPEVKMLWVPSLAAKYVPDGDAVIATSWETAEWAAGYPKSKGVGFYLIQHYESWSGPEERVIATWKLPLKKIVIAGWLGEIASKLGESSFLIHNGLDFTKFALTEPMEARDPTKVLMLYHDIDWKGSPDGVAAFELARAQAPELRLTLFGVVPRPAGLAEDVVFHHNPAQATLGELYNGTSIFLAPSWAEGFPLPPAEAMQCGAALVATDIGGHEPYARDGKTALLNPVKNSEAMAENILRMVREPELRLKIARAGHAKICEFTWEKAGLRFEGFVRESIQDRG